MIKNFFLTTIAYGLLAFDLFWIQKHEYLMENIHKMNLALMALQIYGLYIIMVVGYSILTYIYCSDEICKGPEGNPGILQWT